MQVGAERRKVVRSKWATSKAFWMRQIDTKSALASVRKQQGERLQKGLVDGETRRLGRRKG
eukprot:3030835-Pleurochrysis_carterae.AAC.2